MPKRKGYTVQDLFEDWWEGKMWEYSESYGANAKVLAETLPLDAKYFADALGLKLTPEMKKAIKRGSL